MALTTLHVTNSYHPTSGGIRTFYNALLEAGNRESRRVSLLVPGPRTSLRRVGRFGRIYWVRAPRAPVFDRRYRVILPHTYWPGLRSTITEILEHERPSLVEICDKYSLPYLAAMLRKGWHPRIPRPVLVGLSCERFDDNMSAYLSRSRWAGAFTQWYIRNIYGPPFDAHIAVSQYTACELRSALNDRPDGFIRVGGMGVDVDRFAPALRSPDLRAALLKRAGGRDESVLLLYAGRLSPEKNVALLIDMLSDLVRDRGVDYRLVIAGDGPCAKWLQKPAPEALEGRILLCGTLDRRTLPGFCASADVFVHPNPREPFGIGPLEAMASGIPVVLPAAGGVLEYASRENAWLAEPTGASLANAVRAARHGDAARVTAALRTAHRFRWCEAARRFFDLYDDIHDQFMGARKRNGPKRGNDVCVNSSQR